MALIEQSHDRFIGGISDFDHESMIPDAVYWERCIDFRTNPKHAYILPATIKKSGTIVTDLPKFGDIVGTTVYFVDASGSFYSRDGTTGAYAKLNTAPSSHGNGLSYYPDDDAIYYANDSTIGRYGKLSSSPTFNNDYFTSTGGVPQNTYSLSAVAASSQYAYRADTASLSITGDLSIECNVKPTTLPTTGNQMVFVSKWNESGNIRSYRFGVRAVGGYFGDGSDGSKTVSLDETETVIDSACTGTINTTTLTATNVSFASGQVILIHQSQGTGAGTWMRNKIVGYTAGTVTVDQPLNATYGTGAQVRVLKQYTNVTINSGKTYTAKAWNGTVGGILAFLANGTVTVTGNLSASGCGYLYGVAGVGGGSRDGGYGEGNTGSRSGNFSSSAYHASGGSGGGGGAGTPAGNPSGGGGGGYGSVGANNQLGEPVGGSTCGTSDLTTLFMGSGGGGGGAGASNSGARGGTGGGIIFISAVIIAGSNIVSAGENGQNTSLFVGETGGGGGGAGGSVLLKCQTATLGTNLITASGGSGGYGTNSSQQAAHYGGAGGTGRIHIDYYTSYTGTTTPTITYAQDNNLANGSVNQLYLDVSTNGTAYDELIKQADSIAISQWQHCAVTWTASTSTANFYVNGISIGTSVGTLTAISDNASQFFLATSKDGAGTAVNFYNGLMDDVRVWSAVRSQANLIGYKDVQLIGNEVGLVAYYKLNNAVTDLTSNANDLTNSSCTYSTDVPFTAPNGRFDVDQSQALTGQTFTVPTSITESASNTVTFTPTKDPQKSIDVKLATKGTGDWTLTVHNSTHQVMATKTITNANLPGSAQLVEFVFSSPWRPQLAGGGAQYHFHLTSTVADGTVTTGTTSDLSTVTYNTYFSYLVTRTDYHQMIRFQNFLVILNDKYIGKWDLIAYDPNRIILPGEWTARCATLWNEYLAVGCQRGPNITTIENGRIFFWDGISDQYNFFIDVPEGAIDAMLGSKGIIDFYAGARGQHMRYAGDATASKVRNLPKLDPGTTIEIMPGAMTMYHALLHTGTGPSTSSTVEQGVYVYGSLNPSYPESLGFDHVISTGTRTNLAKIGLLMSFNGKLLIGWKDNVSSGMDEVDQTNPPYTTATIEFMTDDAGRVYKDKVLQRVKAQYHPLISGQTMTPKYQIDDGSWVSATDSTVGSRSSRVEVMGGRFFEYKLGIDFGCTTTTSQALLAVAGQVEDAREENQI
jgi:hypothetical protein